MKKQGLLLVVVTLIDLVTVWPFQGVPMRVVDVLIGVALLATLLFGEKPARPADYFGVGERVRFIGGARVIGANRELIQQLSERRVCGTVLGAAEAGGLLRVKLDCYQQEWEMAPAALAKVNLHFNALNLEAEAFRSHHAK